MFVSVLGPLRVVGDSGPIDVGPPKDRALFCLLALHAGRGVPSVQLIEGLWGEEPPPTAKKGLQTRISAIRSVVPDGTILTEGGGYRLALAPGAVDRDRFDQLLASARQHEGSGDLHRARAAIEEAIGLWRGPPLPELADSHAGLAEIARLEELHLGAHEDLIDLRLMMGEHRSTLADLESLVAAEPLRERRWGLYMVALYRSGRQAEALRAYEQLRRRLADELGVDPGPDLRRIERLVLEHSAELDWQPQPAELTRARDHDHERTAARAANHDNQQDGQSPSARWGGWVSRTQADADTLPFVGRDVELEWLTDLASRSEGNRRPRLVLLLGKGGHGKTRLLTELCRRALAKGVLVAGGSAEHDASFPYGPFSDAVRDALEQAGHEALDDLGHLGGDLAWLVPEIGPAPKVELTDLGLARTRAMEAVLQLFASANGSGPLLLVVDDAHRLGESSNALLRALLDRPWHRPVTVVVACRSDEENHGTPQGEAGAELLRHEGTVVMEVDRLSATDLSRLLGHPDPRWDLLRGEEGVEWLARETGGIPLLVREVLVGLEGVPSPRLTTAKATSISPLVNNVIGRRVARLPERVRRLLEVAAVIGLQFTAPVVVTASQGSAEAVAEVLEESLRSGVISETGQYERYAFDHAIIRDVIAAGVSASRRVRIHGAVAGALVHAGSPLEAAPHVLAGWASLGDEAAPLFLRVLDGALVALEFELVLRLCTEAIERHPELSNERRSDLLLRMGRAQSLAGMTAEADDTWRAAADLARKADDQERFAQVALSTVRPARMTTPSDFRWSLLTEAFERTGPEWTEQRVLVACAWLNEGSTAARRATTPELADEVVAAARALDSRVLVAAYHARHVVARSRPVAERAQYVAELRSLADESGEASWMFHARMACLLDAVAAADGQAATEHLEALRQVCVGFRDPFALWSYEKASATLARLQGRFDVADELDGAAVSLGDRHGIVDARTAFGASLFINAYHRGGLAAMRSALDQFAREHSKVAAWALGAGLAAAADEDYHTARAALERAAPELEGGPQDSMWLPAVCLASEIVGWIGADQEIVDSLESLLAPYAGQIAVVGPLSCEFGPTDRCLGVLAARRGDHRAAEDRFAAAISLSNRIGSTPWSLRSQTDSIVADRSAGRPSRPWWDGLAGLLVDARLEGAAARLSGAPL